MSAYAEYENVNMKDLECLVEALKLMDFNGVSLGDNIKVSQDNDLAVYGYQGDDRTVLKESNPDYSPKASIVIPGQRHPGLPNVVGGASNDIAFTRNSKGDLIPVISEYDASSYNECWMNELRANYLEIKVTQSAKKQGYKVKKKKVDGKVKMTLTRWR